MKIVGKQELNKKLGTHPDLKDRLLPLAKSNPSALEQAAPKMISTPENLGAILNDAARQLNPPDGKIHAACRPRGIGGARHARSKAGVWLDEERPVALKRES